MSFLQLVNILLRHRWVIIGSAFAGMLLMFASAAVKPTSYTSRTSFLTTGSKGLPEASGLAAQFGLTLPSEATQSLQFYQELMDSRQILAPVVMDTFSFNTDSGRVSGSLVDIYDINGANDAVRLDAAVRRLRHEVATDISAKTGIVAVRVTTSHPVLAHHIASRMVEEVNRFNLERRRGQARAEREFVQQRLAEASNDLRLAENRLQNFLLENRELGSPRLTFERDRLMRAVSFAQQIYNSMAESHERAKIEEIRESPVITIFEPADIPLRPNPRGRLSNARFGLISGALLGMVLALLIEYFSRPAGDSPELREMRSIVREMREQLRIGRRRRKGKSTAG